MIRTNYMVKNENQPKNTEKTMMPITPKSNQTDKLVMNDSKPIKQRKIQHVVKRKLNVSEKKLNNLPLVLRLKIVKSSLVGLRVNTLATYLLPMQLGKHLSKLKV